MQASSSPASDAGVVAKFLSALRDELGITVSSSTLALVLVLVGLALAVAVMLRFQPTRLMLGRFAVGLPLDGQKRTNAEPFRSATRRLEMFEDMRPSAWHYKPYAVRALIRWAVLAWFVTLVTGFTLSSWVMLAVAVGAFLAWALVRWRTQVRRASVWAWEHRPHVPARLALGAGRRPGGDALALEAAPGTGLATLDEDDEVDDEAAADPDDAASGIKPQRDLVKEIQEPIWDGARPALELSEMAKAKDYIVLPDSVDRDDSVVTIKLPRAWQGHPEQKKFLDHAVTTRLPGEWEPAYALSGQHHTAKYSRVARPPKKVTFKKWSNVVLTESSVTSPVFGIGPRSKCVASDFNADSPHVLISMGSGAGKSVTVKAVVLPLLVEGAQVYIADPKWNSHKWAMGLPNVHIASTVDEIHDMLIWLAEDAEERQREIAFNDNISHVRRVVILEEMNLLGRKLRKYWKQIKTKEDPKDSPAFDAMADLSAAGRSASYHLIAIAQMLTAHTMGPEGNTARENFATRILGRYSANNWKMLVPEVKPMPSASRTPGRVQVVMGGKATETQVVYYTDDEARRVALSGVVSKCPVPPMTVEAIPGMTGGESRPVPNARDTAAPHEGGTPDWIREIDAGPNGRVRDEAESVPGPFVMGAGEDEYQERPRKPMGPKDAHEAGLFGAASLDTARKALNRAVERGEIAPVEEVQKGTRTEKKFDPVELADWWDTRTTAKN